LLDENDGGFDLMGAVYEAVERIVAVDEPTALEASADPQ